jgi:hypothetical protein
MRLAIGTICLSFFLGQSAPAQDVKPPIPYLDRGACPFECCTYRRWTVEKDTVVYTQRSTVSGVAFRVKKGEYVRGMTGVVITVKPGKVIVKKAKTIGEEPQARVKPGDILYSLHYAGEGIYKVWFRGKLYDEEMPSSPYLITTVAPEQREEYLHVVNEPDWIWWVRVKNSRGQIGWTKQHEHFGNMDACG